MPHRDPARLAPTSESADRDHQETGKLLLRLTELLRNPSAGVILYLAVNEYGFRE